LWWRGRHRIGDVPSDELILMQIVNTVQTRRSEFEGDDTALSNDPLASGHAWHTLPIGAVGLGNNLSLRSISDLSDLWRPVPEVTTPVEGCEPAWFSDPAASHLHDPRAPLRIRLGRKRQRVASAAGEGSVAVSVHRVLHEWRNSMYARFRDAALGVERCCGAARVLTRQNAKGRAGERLW
jgi:hypothetical protein